MPWAGRATTSFPPRRSPPYTAENAASSTASAIAACAPPNRLSTSAGSWVRASMTRPAPSSEASSSFSSVTSMAATVAPAIFAYCTARWPSPPTPEMATSWAGPTPTTLSALYVVPPAQVSGAASSGEIPSGTGWAKSAPGEHFLGVCAVAPVPGVDLLLAERLPAGQAVLAASAGGAEPGHRDALAGGEVSDTVPRGPRPAPRPHDRERTPDSLHRPVALRGMDVGVTEPGGLHPDAHLAGARLGIGTLLDDQGLTKRSHDCCLHRFSPRMVVRVR